MKKIRAFAREESGVILIIIVIAMTVLLAFTSFAVDLGLAYYQKSQLQAAVDSAALAAVHDLPDAVKATATAKAYIQKNGFKVNNVRVSFDATNFTCKVYCHADMKTLFANIFKVSKVDMSAIATSKLYKSQGHHSAVYDYCIFSGNESFTLPLGGQFDIFGSVHSNGMFNCSPGRGYIKGSLEASHGGTFNQWTATAGSVVYNSPVIEMPDFTSCVEQTVPKTYDTILLGSSFKKVWTKQILNGNVMINGNVSFPNQLEVNGNLYVNGNLTVNGGSPVLVFNGGAIYCTGDIKFNNTVQVNSGCIYAVGDIIFSGGTNRFTNTESIAIYSETGDIDLTAAGQEIHGIVYAPMGTVKLAGNNLKFYGNIIADKVAGIPAYLNMGENTFDLPFDIGSEGSTYAALIE